MNGYAWLAAPVQEEPAHRDLLEGSDESCNLATRLSWRGEREFSILRSVGRSPLLSGHGNRVQEMSIPLSTGERVS